MESGSIRMARDLVWIRVFPDEAGATRTQDLLRERGIESVVSGARRSDPWQAAPPPPGFRLGVRAADVRAALDFVWGEAAD